jgi:hypothetical protein
MCEYIVVIVFKSVLKDFLSVKVKNTIIIFRWSSISFSVYIYLTFALVLVFYWCHTHIHNFCSKFSAILGYTLFDKKVGMRTRVYVDNNIIIFSFVNTHRWMHKKKVFNIYIYIYRPLKLETISYSGASNCKGLNFKNFFFVHSPMCIYERKDNDIIINIHSRTHTHFFIKQSVSENCWKWHVWAKIVNVCMTSIKNKTSANVR